MFKCPACLWTCLRAVVPDGSTSLSSSIAARQPLSRGRVPRAHRWPQHRWATTQMAVAHKGSTNMELKSASHGEHIDKRTSGLSAAALERELRYLADPLKFAKNTLDLLRRDEHVKALELTRLASRKMPCTVSWNHLIDYDMSKGRVSAACKSYNEVRTPQRIRRFCTRD